MRVQTNVVYIARSSLQASKYALTEFSRRAHQGNIGDVVFEVGRAIRIHDVVLNATHILPVLASVSPRTVGAQAQVLKFFPETTNNVGKRGPREKSCYPPTTACASWKLEPEWS